MEELESKFIPLQEIVELESNSKEHDVGSIHTSIGRFGFLERIIINKRTGRLIAGHGRVHTITQLKESGEDAPKGIKVENGNWLVPADYVDVDENDEVAASIALNKLVELGGWNEPKLIDNLIAIAGKDGSGLRGTGFDGDELDNLIRMYRPELIETPEDPGPQIDKAEELQEKWRVERGQIWEISRHRLMCGDSTSAEDVGRLMDGEKAGAVVTDPPYGMDLNTDYKDMPETRIASKTYDHVEGDDIDFDASQFIEAFDYCKEQFWWGGDYYYPSLPAYGSWIVWDKRNENSDGLIGNHFEICWSRTSHRRRMIRHHWSGVNARNKDMSRSHPTEKSVDVIAEIIEDYTEANMIIVDLFLGSGTTMVAAEQLNRICYGMEISEKYCSVVLERMSGMGLTPKLVQRIEVSQ